MKRLLAAQHPLRIRVPLIPGWTDGRDNLQAIAEFLVAEAGPSGPPPVDLLPWHHIARDKYQRLGRRDQLAGARPLTDDQIRACAGWLQQRGLTVRTGG